MMNEVRDGVVFQCQRKQTRICRTESQMLISASAGPTLRTADIATDKLALLLTVQRTEYNRWCWITGKPVRAGGRLGLLLYLVQNLKSHTLVYLFYRTVPLSVLTFTQWLHNSIGCNSVTGGGTEGQQTNAQYTTPWKT